MLQLVSMIRYEFLLFIIYFNRIRMVIARKLKVKNLEKVMKAKKRLKSLEPLSLWMVFSLEMRFVQRY